MKRILSYITLLLMMTASVVTGQWNEWSRRPDWSHLMRHLVPQDNLALFVNPGAQMIDGAKGNSQYPALKTSKEIVQNADFHDFTIDYSSIGEPDPHYESNFSTGTDDWGASNGTIVGNVDGIGGEDDVLKFWANGSNSNHFPYTYSSINQTRVPPHTIVRVTGKVFIPSGQTNVDGLEIGTTEGVITQEVKIGTTDTWVDFDAEINNNTDNYAIIRFYETTGGTAFNHIFTGADDSNDDIIYLKDVKFQWVGLVAWWQFDSYYHAQEGTGKTILQDLSGNGYDLTAGSGFDYTNQMTGDDPTYKNGNAVEFDGVDDYATFTSIASILGQNVSISVSINFGDSVSTDLMELVTDAIYNDGGMGVAIKYGNQVSVVVWDGSSWLWFGCDYVFQPNTYYNIVATYDGINKAIYINGISQTINGNAFANAGAGTIGRYPNHDLFYFKGYISNVALFNRAISATEVSALNGKPKNWTWNETGSITNNNFNAVLSGGAELSQDITTDDETLYKEQKISTTDNDVDYFGNTTSHTVTIGDGTWSYAGVKDVTNVSAPSTTVIDYSGNGNNGTAQGGLEVNQPVFPYAWEFDGVDDRIDFGTEVGKMGTNPFLIAGWFKTIATSGTILARRETTDSWYRVHIFSTGILRIEFSYDYGNTTGNKHYEAIYTDNPVNDGNWHFFSVVRDNNKDVWLWVDGVKQTLTCNFPENLDGFSSNTHLFFGCYGTSILDLFAGKIAPVTIYPFDGQDGRASVMPSNYYQRYIQKIYNNTRRYFQ